MKGCFALQQNAGDGGGEKTTDNLAKGEHWKNFGKPSDLMRTKSAGGKGFTRRRFDKGAFTLDAIKQGPRCQSLG